MNTYLEGIRWSLYIWVIEVRMYSVNFHGQKLMHKIVLGLFFQWLLTSYSFYITKCWKCNLKVPFKIICSKCNEGLATSVQIDEQITVLVLPPPPLGLMLMDMFLLATQDKVHNYFYHPHILLQLHINKQVHMWIFHFCLLL